MNNDILVYITAFLDLGRGEWKDFQRSTSRYTEAFLRFVKRFLELRTHEVLVVFMDKKLMASVSGLPWYPIDKSVLITPIDDEWMVAHSPLWRRLGRERKIMESKEYRELLKHRLSFPEHNNPKYTLINHAKIDFIHEAMCMMSDHTYFCWVDFGYCHSEQVVPKKLVDLERIDKNKVCYTLINQLDNNDRDLYYTLKHAPERIGGFFFIGNRSGLMEYRTLYHLIHGGLQDINIVDDDQHLALRCYFARPDLFALYHLGRWHAALEYFGG